jgi:hypothetical protein
MGTVGGYPLGHIVAVGAAQYCAERPSPLWLCSDLSNNTLTGSVPSSLSALIYLVNVCVPPSCQRRLRVRPRRVGIGRHCSERAAYRGMHDWGIEQGGVCSTMRGYGRGTCLLGVRRIERPSPLRVCSLLNENKLTGSLPSSLSALTNLGGLCVPLSSHGVCARAADMRVWIGRLCSERAASGMSASAWRGHRGGRCGSRPVAVLSL